jgi:hypothetical protein
MLENLLKTWAVLAPDELEIKDGGEYILSKTVGWNIYPETVLIYDSFFEEAYTINTLQGYLQRCIEARDEWDWMIVSGSNSKKLKVFDATVFVDGKEFLSTYSTAHEALLTAYMTALAMQRPVTQGSWKHADGDIYWVTDTHEWSGHGFYSFLNEDWSYSLVEDKNIKIQMSSSNYNANKDYGDRAFYDGDSGKWARLTSSFLGLKDDGRLRFEKIND